jgi:hypothetical protein
MEAAEGVARMDALGDGDDQASGQGALRWEGGVQGRGQRELTAIAT